MTPEQLADDLVPLWDNGALERKDAHVDDELRRLAAENAALLVERDLLERNWNEAMATHKNQEALEAENAALRAKLEPSNSQGKYHSCEIPGCIVCLNPERTDDEETP